MGSENDMGSLGIETLCSVWWPASEFGMALMKLSECSFAVVFLQWSARGLSELNSITLRVLHVFLVIETNCGPVSLDMGILL